MGFLLVLILGGATAAPTVGPLLASGSCESGRGAILAAGAALVGRAGRDRSLSVAPVHRLKFLPEPTDAHAGVVAIARPAAPSGTLHGPASFPPPPIAPGRHHPLRC